MPQHTEGTGANDQKGILEIATIPRGPPDGRLKGKLPVQVVTGSGIHPCWLSHQQEKERLVSGERNFRGHRNWKKLWIFFFFFCGNRKALHITSMTQTLAQRMADLHSSSSCTHFLSPPNSLQLSIIFPCSPCQPGHHLLFTALRANHTVGPPELHRHLPLYPAAHFHLDTDDVLKILKIILPLSC